MRAMRPGKAIGLLSTILMAGALAGCGGQAGSVDPGNTLGNILAFNSTNAPAIPASTATRAVDCPQIDVADGQSSFRAFSGSDRSASSVRYQYSLGDLARECSVDASNQIVIRVGVQGNVLAGPGGASGSYNVPVRISIRRESDEKIETTRVYRVATSIPAGQARSEFSVISDPLLVPFKGQYANVDYTILVGFDQGGSGDQRPAKRRGR